MKIVAFGTASTGEGYPRLDVLLDGLARHGVEVHRVLRPLFGGHAEKLRAAGGGLGAAARLVPRMLRTYSRLTGDYGALPPHDAVLVGPLGHLDLLWFRCLPGAERIPVVFDPFVGLHQTIALDRGLVAPGSVAAAACLTLDREACRRADRVLVDTETARVQQSARFGLPAAHFVRILQGQDDRVFRPLADIPAGSPPGTPLEVLFVGTYVPLQGVGTVLEAAARLGAAPVRFTLIGDGQEARAARSRAAALGLTNVTFERRWHSAPELAAAMHRADICLGIFGTSEKAASVVPLKAVAALAMGRPLITRDSPAAREVLGADVSACLVPPGDGEALAAAIRSLASDRARRELLGAAGREVYLARMSPDALGQELKTVFRNLIEERTRSLATV